VRYIKALLIAALAIAALSAMASTTNAALPSVLLPPGVNTSELVAESKTARYLFTSIFDVFGEGYRFQLKQNATMTSLGPALLWFLHAEMHGKTCESPGDMPRNVLIPGQWHTVTALGGSTSLFLLLFLVAPSTELECEGIHYFLQGDVLFDAGPKGSAVTQISTTTGKCSGLVPAYNTFTNDLGEMVTAKLFYDVGGPSLATCIEIEGTQTYNASQTIEVMEP